jgi:hypothetical protein
MKWQHYNNIKSAMWYIEKLLTEIDTSLDKKEDDIYNSIEIDLTKKQVNQIKKQLKKLYAILEETKKIFDLEVKPLKLSRLIDANTIFIWKTIEDSWSSEMEKSHGKISSVDKKKQIDKLLSKIMQLTNKIRETAKYETI